MLCPAAGCTRRAARHPPLGPCKRNACLPFVLATGRRLLKPSLHDPARSSCRYAGYSYLDIHIGEFISKEIKSVLFDKAPVSPTRLVSHCQPWAPAQPAGAMRAGIPALWPSTHAGRPLPYAPPSLQTPSLTRMRSHCSATWRPARWVPCPR